MSDPTITIPLSAAKTLLRLVEKYGYTGKEELLAMLQVNNAVNAKEHELASVIDLTGIRDLGQQEPAPTNGFYDRASRNNQF